MPVLCCSARACRDGVIVAKVDADSQRNLGSRFDVKSFPTLKWFPKGSTTPEDYSGGRSALDIVTFINSKTGKSICTVLFNEALLISILVMI
jgi:hypothetical protein